MPNVSTIFFLLTACVPGNNEPEPGYCSTLKLWQSLTIRPGMSSHRRCRLARWKCHCNQASYGVARGATRRGVVSHSKGLTTNNIRPCNLCMTEETKTQRREVYILTGLCHSDEHGLTRLSTMSARAKRSYCSYSSHRKVRLSRRLNTIIYTSKVVDCHEPSWYWGYK